MIHIVYYDDGTRKKLYRYKRRERKFMSLLLAFVFGAFLFAVLLPFLANQDLLPYTVVRQDDLNRTAIERISLDLDTDLTEVVERTMPTVVGVENERQQVDGIFGQGGGTGSGVIYKQEDGSIYIVTNQHVIEGATGLNVIFASGQRVEATLLGEDVFTDLAVLVVNDPMEVTTAEFGDSDLTKVGEDVFAIGNPLGLDLSGSVTRGIISGKERMIPIDLSRDGRVDWQVEVMQTDAAINPGNSGGALINRIGQLIGINSMKIAESAIEGIGFTIPINEAIPVIQELEADGEVRRAFLGIEAYSLVEIPRSQWQETLSLPEDITQGVVLERIVAGSPAEQGQLERFDVIVRLDDTPVNTMIELRKYLYRDKAPGEVMMVHYYRGEELLTTELELSTQSE